MISIQSVSEDWSMETVRQEHSRTCLPSRCPIHPTLLIQHIHIHRAITSPGHPRLCTTKAIPPTRTLMVITADPRRHRITPSTVFLAAHP